MTGPSFTPALDKVTHDEESERGTTVAKAVP